MSEHINAKEYNLWDLMSGEFIFNIPEYQRPYSWTQNEAVTLWDDLVDFWYNWKADSNQSYFIGSIVLVKETGSPNVEVIDGQQRLSTLSIILSIMLEFNKNLEKDLRKCLWEEGIQHKGIPGRARLSLREKDKILFNTYIAEGKVSELLSKDMRYLDNDAQRLIYSNSEALHVKIAEFSQNCDLSAFIQMLFDKCYFVVVTTSDNESAFRVFSVMNNRGLSLLPSDIIKAHIIGEIKEESRKYYTDKWEDIEANLGRESFNSLLSHIRMIYAKNKLHGTLVNEFERLIFKEVKNKEDVITEIIEPYAIAYVEIEKGDYIAAQGAELVNELFSWLRRIDDSDWMPVLMYALVYYRKDCEFIGKFVNNLERLAAFFYLTSKTSNQRIERYGRVINALQGKNIDKAFSEMELDSKEQKNFLETIGGDVYLMPARKRSYLLLRLDRFLSDKAADYKNDIFSIEHVMPQNPKDNSKWLEVWADERTREYWLHKIANLIPLTRKKNSQAQNYEFEEKKKKYFSEKGGVSSYAITTEIILEKEWTPESVKNRQDRLLGILASCWRLLQKQPINSKDGEKPSEHINTTEALLQQKLWDELDYYFAQNPGTKIPQISRENLKVGQFVRTAWHNLVTSGYGLSNEQISKLCSIEYSKKYTHRNLAFMIRVEGDNSPNTLKRYWTSPEYIEKINGEDYYIFSEWYPDTKESKDAHCSDFLNLYYDIATNLL